jgi:NADH-quinone oxidoreductase subunit F
MQCEKTLRDIRGIEFPYSADRDRCPVDYSLQLLSRLMKNICGKGVFCRDSSAQLEKILSGITAGAGKSGDIELINEICSAMELLCDCEMSKAASGQIAELIRSNPETWEAHVTRHRCPSTRCANLSLFYIDPVTCTGCGLCVAACPENAIDGGSGMIHVISPRLCSRCGKCEAVCPEGSIRRSDVAGVPPRTPSEPMPVGSFKAAVPGTGLRKGLRK